MTYHPLGSIKREVIINLGPRKGNYMKNNKTVHPDTEDKGHGFWKNGKWCQSATTKKAQRDALKSTRPQYRTGREAVFDE